MLTGVVIANKVDLEQKQVVSGEDGQAFANSIGFEFFEVSALQSKGLEDPFKALSQMFYQKYEEKIASLTDV